MTFHLNKKAIFGDECDLITAPHRPLRLWLWLLVLTIVLLLIGMTAARGQVRPGPVLVPRSVTVLPSGLFVMPDRPGRAGVLPDRARLDPAIIAPRDPGIDPRILVECTPEMDPGIFGGP